MRDNNDITCYLKVSNLTLELIKATFVIQQFKNYEELKIVFEN